MAYIITSANELSQVVAPRLPNAPGNYEPRYIDQLNNVLRLYFNQFDKIIGQLSTSAGVIPPTTVYTVSTLPSAATSGVGARSFVSDANATTFASIVAAGGANKVPVYSDGTNWRIG
jgi:hypothetical protein